MTKAAIVITPVERNATSNRGGLERVAGVMNKLAEGEYAGIKSVFAIVKLNSLSQPMKPEGLLALTTDWPLGDIGVLHGTIAVAAEDEFDVRTFVLATETIQPRHIHMLDLLRNADGVGRG